MLSPRRARFVRALSLALVTLGIAVAAPATQAAPTWLTPTTLSAAGQPVEVPQVASSPRGDAVAVWQRSDGTNQIVQAASRPAGGAWQAPVSLSAAGEDGLDPQVATDPLGNAVAVWYRSNGTSRVIQAAVRPAGGAWPTTPDTISIPGGDAYEPHVALDGQGNAVAVWRRYNGANIAIVQAAFRPAGGPWQPSVSLSAIGQNAYSPRVAFDPAGNALAVWYRSDGSRDVVQASLHPAGGAWQAPIAVSGTGLDASYPELAIDGQGNAVVVFSRAGTNYRIQAATRTAGGLWQAPVFLSPAGVDTLDQRVAVDAAGDTVAAWLQDSGTAFAAETAVRPAGGEWQAPAALSDPSSSADAVDVGLDAQGDATVSWVWGNGPGGVAQSAVRPRGGAWGAPVTLAGSVGATDMRLTVDEQGNATALWRRYDGANTRAQAAGYDAAGPQAQAFTAPSTAAVGESVAFSVALLDAWSALGSISWTFGDGATADGAAVSHAYAAPGTYAVNLTSTDALGNATTKAATVQVIGTSPVDGSGGGGASGDGGAGSGGSGGSGGGTLPTPTDTAKPMVTLTPPACAKRLSKAACRKLRAKTTSWRTLRGMATDTGGSGVARVEVAAARQVGRKLYVSTGTRFAPSTTKGFQTAYRSATLKQARWSLKLPKLTKGTHLLRVRVTDHAGNVSAVLTRTLKLR